MRKVRQTGIGLLLSLLLSCTACMNAAVNETEIVEITVPPYAAAATVPPVKKEQTMPMPASTAEPASTPTATPSPMPTPTWPMKTFKYKPAGYITAHAVNMRIGPGTEYGVINKLNEHSVVTMLAESGDWYFIAFEGTEGFVSREFVKIGELTTPKPSKKYSDDEIYMAAQMIWLEAKGGTYEEFQAIANVLANRIASRQFPDTVEDNIFAPGQFSVADDREWFLSKKPGRSAKRAADSVLNGGERPLDKSVMYFRAKSRGTEWGGRKYVKTIGNHCFFR